MKNRNGYKLGKVGKETQHEDRQRGDRSERGFGKLSARKALPLALVLAVIFSIAVVTVSGGPPRLPVPHISGGGSVRCKPLRRELH